MGTPYIGEIRIFAGNFAPSGWATCDGQLLPISENDTLFNLIGTTYGGDGESTFALPDLRSRVPVHQGTATSGTVYNLSEAAGVESITLTVPQLPVHNHPVLVSADPGNTSIPQNNFPAANAAVEIYRAQNPTVAMDATAVGTTGGSQPHSNLQPYLCLNFIISLYGIYPTPT